MARKDGSKKLNKAAREKFAASLPETPKVGVVLVEESKLPGTFQNVKEAYDEYALEGSPVEGMFSTCPTCNDEKVRKSRAIEASKRTEMLGTIAGIVKTFKNVTDAKFAQLSQTIQDQMKPIVEASTKLALAKNELAGDLEELEESLKFAFGIKDEIPSEVTEAAMFPTEDTVLDVVFEPQELAPPTEFDKTVDTMFDDMDSEDETASAPRPTGRVVN